MLVMAIEVPQRLRQARRLGLVHAEDCHWLASKPAECVMGQGTWRQRRGGAQEDVMEGVSRVLPRALAAPMSSERVEAHRTSPVNQSQHVVTQHPRLCST